jgi:hypothetical protein
MCTTSETAIRVVEAAQADPAYTLRYVDTASSMSSDLFVRSIKRYRLILKLVLMGNDTISHIQDSTSIDVSKKHIF